jgi:hypothetical protein
LNDQDRLLIKTRLGAYWDPQLRQWLAVWQEKKGEPLPFSRQAYERYSNVLVSTFSLAGPNIKNLREGLKVLLGNLQPKDIATVLLTIHHFILDFARQKKVGPEIIERLEELQPDLKCLTIKQPGRDKALADLEESETETPANSVHH